MATKKKIHPWRLCPVGEHWVRTHAMRVRPSQRKPAGSVTTRHEHCADNPSRKGQLYPDEIMEVAERHFQGVKKRPCAIDLGYGKKGSTYDQLIAGWVQYWNDILQPKESLDPNLVKALIASESGFDPNVLADKRNGNSARGLTQITNATQKILCDEDGEIKDHYLTVTREELNAPAINTCAGVRWLFHKRDLASIKLKRQATWLEAVYEYKGASRVSEKRAHEIMKKFLEKLEKLKKCGK